MVEYVEVEIGERRASARLTNITFIVGTGKTTFLETLYKIISNIGKNIPKISRDVNVFIQAGDVSYGLSLDRKRVRQTISVGGEEVVFEWVPSKSIHRLIKPIDVSIASADVIMPTIRTQEHVSIVAEEDLERLNNLVLTARRRLALDALYIGPYVDPHSAVDASKPSTKLDRHGRNLAQVLSHLALHKPNSFDAVKTHVKKLGLSLAVGLAKPGKIGAMLYGKSGRIPLSKAPCSMKMFLTLATALELAPDVLFVENFDYCLTPKTAEALTLLLRQKKTKVMAEIHREEVAEWIRADKSTIVVDL